MIKIDEITLNASIVRGDYGTITVQNNIRDFTDGDKVILTIKKSKNDEEVELQKEITTFNEDGTATIEFLAEDTSELEIGDYVYDINWLDGTKPHTFLNGEELPLFTIVKGATNG